MNVETPKPPAGGEARAPVDILTVVLLYAALAASWILFSDKAMEWLFSDPEHLLLAGTVKGWLFVAVTSLLLYRLLRRRSGHAAQAARPRGSRWRIATFLLLLTTVISALTAGAIGYTFDRHEGHGIAQLQAIADLKTRQIADWLDERRSDARFVQSSRFLAENYQRWRDAGDSASRDTLQERLEVIRKGNGFQAALLLDKQGALVWDSSGDPVALEPGLRAAARQAAADHQVSQFGPYCDAAGHLHLDFIAPLMAMGKHSPVVVLRANPSAYLNPILQVWPVPSASAETLLFRRDGDDVLYLNELRHVSGAAVKLRLPVAAKELLAAQVLRGEAKPGSLIAGVDYRGVPAVGMARAIPGTDWFLIAKLDKSELHAEAIKDSIWIGLTGLLVLFMGGVSVLLFRQRQELAFAQEISQAQADKLHALHLLAAIADSSSDAIFAKDMDDRFILFNRAAARMTGKAPEEVLGRDETALFPRERAEQLLADNRKVMASNRALTFQYDLNMLDGEHTFLTTKGPLHDPEGRIIGMYGFARDITEIKEAEDKVRILTQRITLATDAASIGIWDWDVKTDQWYATPIYSTMLGYDPEEGFSSRERWIERTHPDDRDAVSAKIRGVLAGDNAPYQYEARLRHADGSYRWLSVVGRIVEQDERGKASRMLGIRMDITERKLAESKLAEQIEELRRWHEVTLGREMRAMELKREVNELLTQAGQPPRYPSAEGDTE
jgi:PAS domain S-box-containing protein